MDNQIRLPDNFWENHLKLAQQDICSCYYLEAVVFPPTVKVPSVQIYKRKYNRSKVDVFESVQKGSSVRIDILVRTTGTNIAPGTQGLRKLLEHIGQWIGISPWGGKYNYGRFEVVHVTPVRYTEQQEKETINAAVPIQSNGGRSNFNQST